MTASSSSFESMLPIAVDVMGADKGPQEIIKGALFAYEKYGIPIILVGDPAVIGDSSPFEVIPALEVIEMHDEPASAVRRKQDASVLKAAEAVRDGRACAMVSPGNTGAAMVSALWRIGRIKGISRPAIATPLPLPSGDHTILLDAGANVDCSASWLAQFGQMGSVFAKTRFGLANPKVGLLSNGEEDSKGNSLVKQTHEILKQLTNLNFIGNVEGGDLLLGAADVVVTDGFTGNIVLKALEGSLKVFLNSFMSVIASTEQSRQAGEILFPLLQPIIKKMDPESTGGAMLLGIDGVCIISHGSSSSVAISNAVVTARDMVSAKLVQEIKNSISSIE